MPDEEEKRQDVLDPSADVVQQAIAEVAFSLKHRMSLAKRWSKLDIMRGNAEVGDPTIIQLLFMARDQWRGIEEESVKVLAFRSMEKMADIIQRVITDGSRETNRLLLGVAQTQALKESRVATLTLKEGKSKNSDGISTADMLRVKAILDTKPSG